LIVLTPSTDQPFGAVQTAAACEVHSAVFPRTQTLGLDVRPRPGLTQHNTEKGTTDLRVIAPRPSLPSTRRSTCRTSRNFELPDPRERMNFLGATRTTEEADHRLPTCRSLRRPPPNGASEGRPMIPVWCTHAGDHRSATRAAVGIPPSRSQPCRTEPLGSMKP
jgi:hypothetical protein